MNESENSGLCKLINLHVHTTRCLKNDTDVAQYNFDADQPILIIFTRGVAERVCY